LLIEAGAALVGVVALGGVWRFMTSGFESGRLLGGGWSGRAAVPKRGLYDSRALA
jgi:hypothetical protein